MMLCEDSHTGPGRFPSDPVGWCPDWFSDSVAEQRAILGTDGDGGGASPAGRAGLRGRAGGGASLFTSPHGTDTALEPDAAGRATNGMAGPAMHWRFVGGSQSGEVASLLVAFFRQ